jgi:hypothetical protein
MNYALPKSYMYRTTGCTNSPEFPPGDILKLLGIRNVN